jgi:hypothetical protein
LVTTKVTNCTGRVHDAGVRHTPLREDRPMVNPALLFIPKKR